MQTKRTLVCFALVLFAAGDAGRDAPHFAPRPKPESPSGDQRSLALRKAAYREYQSGNLHLASTLYDQAYESAIASNDGNSALIALQNSAGVGQLLFQYRTAMRKFLAAKPLAARLGNAELQIMLASNIASLYLQMGELDLARMETERVLPLLKPGIPAGTRAGLLANAADVWARKGELHKALPLSYEAINAAAEQPDLAFTTEIWDHLGDAFLRAGRIDDANEAFTESYRLRRMGIPALLPASWVKLGNLRLAQGRAAEGERFLTMTVDRPRGTRSSTPLWKTLYSRGLARKAQSKDWQALEDFRAARDQVRRWRLEVIPADAVRITTNVGLGDLYSEYCDTALRLYERTGQIGLFQESLLAFEENRASSLRESAAELPKRLPPAYWDDLAKLRLRAAAVADSQQLDALRLRLVEMETQAGLPGPAPAAALPGFRTVQRRLGPDDCLLAFKLGKAGSVCWAVTRDRCFLNRLPPGTQISQAAREFAGAVRTGSPDAADAGARLHGMLFAGLPAGFRSKRTWKLALDDALFGLPFSALVVGRKEARPLYLLEEHRLEIIPGALMTMPAEPPPSPLFVGFGDAIYNHADKRMRPAGAGPVQILNAAAHDDSRLELNRLIGSGTEVESCSRAWTMAGLQRIIALGPEVNRDRLRREISARPAVLHLATHVVPSRSEPGTLAVALGFGRDGVIDLVSPSDVGLLRTDVGLVALSGCASGSGPVLPGAGLLGLTRGWLLAGARSVIASYWPVPDEDGVLFRDFYRRLGGALAGQTTFCPSSALREAQLEMLQAGGSHAEPRFWSAYFTVSKGLPE